MTINILFILLILILIWRIVSGYQNGMVKELVSLIGLIVLSIFIVLLGFGLKSYMEKEVAQVVAAVILVLVLILLYKLLNFFFFTAELFSKLPIVKSVDKLLGMVLGIAETVILIWVMYTILNIFDMGTLEEKIRVYIQENMGLNYLYQLYEEYISPWISILEEKVEFFISELK